MFCREQFVKLEGSLEEVGDMKMTEKYICLKKNLSLGPSLVYMIWFNLNHAGLKLDFALNKKNRKVLMVSIATLLFESPNIKQNLPHPQFFIFYQAM